ncbi:hypothetical protein HNV12_12890 [Methanococcoides sp. SA1]|uniref:hypothetical protein n=1 Tax=Lentimicrobium sp. L6 TaxID=2735916 RepID=UPI0015533FEE|nr:hypothetical protein [Lentimicrobium sp. L6]NPD84825.1 hypothetical protein [Lentimicrobium sp. L6]NPE28835.1 hypothetical protein [Methanococcoides sp. SA1]
MRPSFANFILEIIGAFIVWSFKGFKGKLSDEVSSPFEANSKSIRNAFISILLIISIIFIISNLEDSKTKEPAEFKYEILK